MSFKKLYLLLVFPILSFVLFSQEVYEQVFVINIEVPIRVFKSGAFVDNLTLDSFSSPQYSDLPLEYKLMRYSDILHRIENLRKVDQQKLLDFAKLLKNTAFIDFKVFFYYIL